MYIGYLCGPIAGCNNSEAKDWRDWVKNNYPEINWLDPLRRDYRGSGHATNDNGSMPDYIVKEIVELDKIDIARSDILLANMLPDKTKTGSNMEIIYAWTLGKLVVIVHDPNKPVSPWHRYHAHKVVATLEEALDYIKNGHWQ